MKNYILVFIPVILMAACTGKRKDEPKETKAVRTKIQLAIVESGGVATVIKLPAQLAAYQEVSIFPKVNGYVKKVLVDVGSRVSQGTVLMILEAPELEQAVMQAKEKLAKAKAEYLIDRERYERLAEAARTPGAISPMDISTIKAKMEADSSVWNAEKANWEMQKTMRNYLTVTAPFGGVITERNVHPGALVSASLKDKPMLELKQVDRLRLQVDIPESISSSLQNKDTVSFYVSALPAKRLTGFISRRSMNVSSNYRSERMEIDVKNENSSLSPGMYADVIFYSKGNAKAVWVPKSAVVTSTERKYVLVVHDEKTTKVNISTGNETAEKVEIFGGIKPGDKVILNATDEMKEGIQQ